MDNFSVLAMLAMFFITVTVIAIFARPETAEAVIKVVGDAMSKLLGRGIFVSVGQKPMGTKPDTENGAAPADTDWVQ